MASREQIERACKAHAPQWDRMDETIKEYARQQMSAALDATLAPGEDVEKLVKWLRERANVHTELQAMDKSAEPWPDLFTGAADALEAQAAQIASLSAKVAEVELANADLELIADENADNVRLIDKIAKLIGIPHDQELTIQDVHVWKHAVEARASELQREVERLRKAIDDALGRHQVTHIHAGLRAALQQEGESDV